MNFYERNRRNERFPLFLKFRNTCYTLFLLFSNITFCIDLFTFKIYTFSLEESLHKIVDCCEMINDETSKHTFRSTRDIFLTDSTIKDCEEDKISTLNIQHLWSRNFLCTQTHTHIFFHVEADPINGRILAISSKKPVLPPSALLSVVLTALVNSNDSRYLGHRINYPAIEASSLIYFP